MKNIHALYFGAFPIRFAGIDNDLFVSRDDLLAALHDCFVPRLRGHVEAFVNQGLAMMGDEEDRRGAALGEDAIGPVIHFHAVANLLHALGDMTDVDDDDMRESSYRVHALARWYVQAVSSADDHFGRDLSAMVASVKSRLDRLNPPLAVTVTQGEGMFTAHCEALHLVTEAESFEALTERVWEVAPDLIEANRLALDPEGLRLSFEFEQSAPAHRLVL